jgi:hypothetical protein
MLHVGSKRGDRLFLTATSNKICDIPYGATVLAATAHTSTGRPRYGVND